MKAYLGKDEARDSALCLGKLLLLESSSLLPAVLLAIRIMQFEIVSFTDLLQVATEPKKEQTVCELKKLKKEDTVGRDETTVAVATRSFTLLQCIVCYRMHSTIAVHVLLHCSAKVQGKVQLHLSCWTAFVGSFLSFAHFVRFPLPSYSFSLTHSPCTVLVL